MAARIVLLVTSPRLPVGLLTATAWDLLRTHPVLTGADPAWVSALREAGVRLLPSPEPAAGTDAAVAALLTAAADQQVVVWFAGPTGDPDLARQLGIRLAREPGVAELELVYGSWDPAGARLLDAVSVIDRLASPGGDPWKQQQTHESLAQYLLEECYEAYDAIEAGDLTALREELGDLLLQVVLHARMAEQLPEEQRWSVDDVAADLVAKMIRRNPHVFAGQEVADVAEIIDNWERIKKAEKQGGSALAGVAMSQPALALAAKLLTRADRAGLPVAPPSAPVGWQVTDPERLGESLLGVVAAARAAGVDAEAALRRAALAYADRVRAAEAG
ncbi:MazG family protein [Natronosporangium hydrolyticum]|uniref:MazG family protein n=1 Tax=Natronosporangium hydrolyticum TaxID=2811111 RepID=A0A895YJH4_9ACTN|nr:MazG family protein [Natronosporangium hydrolyticum]QSB14270.1 MazG family protein [Natronosporangium hydrolyticum]